jgi:hypothetical protein
MVSTLFFANRFLIWQIIHIFQAKEDGLTDLITNHFNIMQKRLGLFLVVFFFSNCLIAQTPTITSFSPTTAGVGDTLTIIGTNLEGGIVNINCNTVTPVNTDTVIKAIVCLGALSGTVYITTGTGSVSKPGFIFNSTPLITAVSPDSATAGQTVTITGKYLCPGGTAYPNLPPTISFGGVPAASITVISTNVIQAVIGLGASGSIYLTNCCFGASTFPFTYLTPKPIVNSFTPLTGENGRTITIEGKYFTGTTAVSFGGNAAQSFTVVSDTVITAVVGVAASGNISITTPGGTQTIAGFTKCTPSYSATNVTICSTQLPYTWNGKSYTAIGNYNDTLVNAAGCDSIASLDLVVNSSTTSITSVSICSNQLPYIWNGKYYISSGSFRDSTTNFAGCDSFSVLNLTVEDTSRSTTQVTICQNQLPYAWNRNLYASGVPIVLL